VAVDVARSALRLGAKKVEIYYRRSRNEMPAIPEEVEGAIQEGVKIHFLASPLKIVGKGGTVAEMECVRMKLGEPDRSGRRKPIPLEGSNFRVEADTIIAAIGQRVDQKGLRGLVSNQDGTVRINPGTGETSLKGVFAGGDLVRGPGWAIDAIADGKKGAQSIHEYLS
jgi:NADPH-dependent glutamate synthase beta subunit-like oxidoreductase